MWPASSHVPLRRVQQFLSMVHRGTSDLFPPSVPQLPALALGVSVTYNSGCGVWSYYYWEGGHRVPYVLGFWEEREHPPHDLFLNLTTAFLFFIFLILHFPPLTVSVYFFMTGSRLTGHASTYSTNPFISLPYFRCLLLSLSLSVFFSSPLQPQSISSELLWKGLWEFMSAQSFDTFWVTTP